VRTVPVPAWVKTAVDKWTENAPIANGKLFRSIRKNGTVWGDGITQNVVWYVVKGCAAQVGTPRPEEDLREIVPRCGRRIGADPVPAGTCLRSDHRTIHRLQAGSGARGERSAPLCGRARLRNSGDRSLPRRGFRNSYCSGAFVSGPDGAIVTATMVYALQLIIDALAHWSNIFSSMPPPRQTA